MANSKDSRGCCCHEKKDQSPTCHCGHDTPAPSTQSCCYHEKQAPAPVKACGCGCGEEKAPPAKACGCGCSEEKSAPAAACNCGGGHDQQPSAPTCACGGHDTKPTAYVNPLDAMGCCGNHAHTPANPLDSCGCCGNHVQKPARPRNMWRRFWISAPFALLLIYVAMAPMMSFLPFSGALEQFTHDAPLAYAGVQMALLLPILVVCFDFYTGGFSAIWRRKPNMESLVAVSTSAALIYSLYHAFLIATGHPDAVHSLYFDCAGVILALILFGEAMETTAKGKAGEAIVKMMNLAPKTAVVVREGNEVEIPIEQVVVGDLLTVRPGGQIAVDGQVVNGTSAINESMLTGESLPVDKAAGDAVYAATLSTNGAITFRAEKVGQDTALARMVRLVEEAQAGRAPIAKLADKVSAIFVPLVSSVALLSGIGWLIFGGDLQQALMVFIAVLVISCPCALGLATPAAIMVGIGKGAQRGILIKNGEALQAAGGITAVVLDKTGTLTWGKPKVTDILPQGMCPEQLLALAAGAERGSEHPLGQAIVARAQQDAPPPKARDFIAQVGRGVRAVVEGKSVVVGNRSMMRENDIDTQAMEADADRLAQAGKTPMYVAVDGRAAGLIAVADTPKDTAAQAVEKLRAMGKQVIMLTGDGEGTARAIAGQIGVDHVLSEVLPEDKVRVIRELQQQGQKVAMVGDGINDAPALAQADVGIAIGTGTDVAMASADIVLMRDDVTGVPAALRLGQLTMRNIRQNLFWAFGYNVLAIPLAAAGLLSPMLAAAAMCLSDISLLTNVLRLKGQRIE